MSDVQNNENESKSPESEVADQDAFVPKKAYQEVSKDMLKYKTEMKNLAAQLSQLQAEKEAKEVAQLQEQEKWHDLYKKSEAKLAQLAQERDTERNKFVDFHKKNAVIEKLGGFKKPEYTKFINTNEIEMNEDGSIVEDSINAQVEKIRKTYPELIKSSPKGELPNAAPKGAFQKSVSDMTPAELNAARRELLTKK